MCSEFRMDLVASYKMVQLYAIREDHLVTKDDRKERKKKPENK
jgi:hypothetical protein